MTTSQNKSNSSNDAEIQNLLTQRNYEQARTLIDQKIQRSPQSADAYYLLGVFHYFQGQIGEAVKGLSKSLELDPKHTDAAICLSVLYNDIGKYEEARGVFELANKSIVQKRSHSKASGDPFGVDKKFAVKHLEIADLYFRYRRFDEAAIEYSKAASLDPSTPEIRIRLAKTFAKKGQTSRALQELQQLTKENPRFLMARIQLGLLHYSQGNVLDAELEWEAVLEIDPEHREAQSYLEMAKYARTKPSSATMGPPGLA